MVNSNPFQVGRALPWSCRKAAVYRCAGERMESPLGVSPTSLKRVPASSFGSNGLQCADPDGFRALREIIEVIAI